MTTKTASIRLDKELYDKIDEHCVTEQCSRNDFIKSAIESKLNKEDDDVAEHKPYYDSFGNRFYWDNNDKEWVCEVDPKNVKAAP